MVVKVLQNNITANTSSIVSHTVTDKCNASSKSINKEYTTTSTSSSHVIPNSVSTIHFYCIVFLSLLYIISFLTV